MATKTLKHIKQKIAPKKVVKKGTPAVILVGTYKERQLAFIEREGVYNYPIGADDKLKPEDAAQVKELWLYAGRTKTARQVFEATFVGIQSKEEFLAAHPTYPKSKSIDAFWRRHSMAAVESYLYQVTNKGLEFFDENHDSLNCLPKETLVEDLEKVCRYRSL